jgi:hypothetical protein
MSDKKVLIDAMNDLRSLMEEGNILYEASCNEFWENLSYEDKLKAFYAVCKRIHKADIQERGSYRSTLYNVFDFGMDSYGIGMECGYMDIHNYIFAGIESDKDIDESTLQYKED